MSNELEQELKLPEGWVSSTINNLSFIITKGSTPTTYGFSYQKQGINFVKAENIVNRWIDHETINEFISQEAFDYLKRSQLQENDVLFSIAGTIGRTTIVRKIDLPANTNQAIAIIRCPWQYIEPRFIRLILDSPILFNSFSVKRRGVGMDNVSLEDIRNLMIPIPPLNEQKRIVEKIKELTYIVDFMENEFKKALGVSGKIKSSKKINSKSMINKFKRLRDSILHKSFQGNMVPQDPNDESAEILIEKIKNEKKLYEEKIKQEKKALKQKEKSKKRKKNGR